MSLTSTSGQRRVTIVLVAGALVSLHARPAPAQEEPEALIRQGVELRRKGQDALAQGYFKRAYVIAHTPRSAAQLGLVEQALGQYLDAEQHLGEALDSADVWVEQQRPVLEHSRQAVRAHLARVQVRGISLGATVRVADRPAAPVAADGTVWVPPGSVTLTFAAPDCAPVIKDVSASEAETLLLDVELRPARPARPAPALALAATPARPEAHGDLRAEDGGGSHAMRVAGVVVASAGGALVVAGVVTYLAGSSKLDAINRDASAGTPYNTANDNYQTLGNIGTGLAIAGGVAITAGAALYFLNREPGAGAGVARVSLGYMPGAGGQLQLGGRF